ncbi:hypothetical protein DFJ73DRAFT_319537 [Zopfochytrium polystomum]|nr:hypothetical protein DFJ73DRAFT_319537 [Zopfochytrium polystomum]
MQIPGYFYDAEKKRYFKIMATSKATPGSAFTKDVVQSKQLLVTKKATEQGGPVSETTTQVFDRPAAWGWVDSRPSRGIRTFMGVCRLSFSAIRVGYGIRRNRRYRYIRGGCVH